MKEWFDALQAEAAEIQHPTERLWWLITGTFGLCLKGVHMHILKFALALWVVLVGAWFALWDASTSPGMMGLPIQLLQRDDSMTIEGQVVPMISHHTVLELPVYWLVLVALGVLARLLKVSHRTLLLSAAFYVPLCHLIDVMTLWTVPFSFDVQEGALALMLLILGWNFPVQHFRKQGPLHRFATRNGHHLMLLLLVSSALLTLANTDMPVLVQFPLLFSTCIFLGGFYWKKTPFRQLTLWAAIFGLLFPVAFYFTVPLYGGFILYSTLGSWHFPGYLAPQWSMVLFVMVLFSALASRMLSSRKTRLT